MIIFTAIVGAIMYLVSKVFRSNKEVTSEQNIGDRDR